MCEFLRRTRPNIVLRMQEAEFEKGHPFPSLQKEYGDRIEPWAPPVKPDVDCFSEMDLVPAVDLVVTVGGDGTLLFASSLFQLMCPPMMSFALGSLGFLTPFDFNK
jgi:NAD kinase